MGVPPGEAGGHFQVSHEVSRAFCTTRSNKWFCFSSQLKYVFRLVENVSRDTNFRLARDQVVQPESRKYFLQSWQLNAFKKELKKKFNSFFGTKTFLKRHPQCRENVERLLKRAKFGRKLSRFKQNKVTPVYNWFFY